MTQTSGQIGWRRSYLLAALSVVILGLHTLGEPFGRDQGIHATIAYAWGEGLTPYTDVYNIKPPLTTLMHRLSQMVFGANTQAIRAWDMLAVLLSAVAMVRIMQLLDRSRAEASFTAIGFALIYYALTYWEHAQTDGWAGMCLIAMVWGLLTGWDRPDPARSLWMIGAGVAIGTGFMFKYTIGAAGLLIFLPVIAGGPALRFRLRDLILFFAGALTIIGGILVALALAGALAPFLEIQNYIRSYIAYAAQNPSPMRMLTVLFSPNPVTGWITLMGGLLWLAALMRGQSLVVWTIAIWGGAAFLSGYVQGKGFAYHFLPLIPVFAMLWGMFMAALHGALVRRLVSLSVARAIMVLLLGWSLLATPIYPRSLISLSLWLRQAPLTDYHAIYPMPPDFNIEAIDSFAAQLNQIRTPGDTLFVWGYETMLYLLAQEPPRYRYPYAWPFVVDFHDGRYTADLMARLGAHPPKHIVVQNRDATPWVTGRPQSSADFLALFPELNAFIEQSYDPVLTTDRFRLLERRD